MNKQKIRILFGLGILTLLISCTEKPETKVEPKFITSDIELFWQVYDESYPDFDQEYIKTNYVDKGSIGLKDFDKKKNICPDLQNRLRQDRYFKYYNSIRNNTNDLTEVIEVSREGYNKFENIYSDFRSTNVFFLIGALTAGGKKSDNGLMIAVEFFTKTDTTSLELLSDWLQKVIREKTYIPNIVIHELVHFNQNFSSHNIEYNTLLEQSIMEGMADYIALHILPNEPFFNQHLHDFADTIEQKLWNEFKVEKDLNYSNTEWLYTGKNTSQGYPADLGYYIGFKILDSYSKKFDDINNAIQNMLSNPDYYDIFKKSGYEEKFE